MKLKALIALLAAAAAISCAGSSSSTSQTGKYAGGSDANTCVPPDKLADEAAAKTFSGAVDQEGASVLFNGRRIWPSGESINLNFVFPWGLALSKDGKTAYVSGAKKGFAAVNLETKEITRLNLGSVSVGMAVSGDGKTLYVGGGGTGKIHVLDIAEGAFASKGEIDLCEGYIAGLALTSDDKLLYAVDAVGSRVFVVELEKPLAQDCGSRTTIKAGYYPYYIAVHSDNKKAYVSNMSGNTVSVLDLEAKKETKQIKVGKNPEGMAFSPDYSKLYVANSDSSTVSVIDLASNAVVNSIQIDPNADTQDLKTMYPQALLMDFSNSRLYVACARMNAVYIVDTLNASYPVIGKIATGAYPNALAMKEGSGRLISADGQGKGSVANGELSSHQPEQATMGTLTVITLPVNDSEMAAMTKRADDNINRPLTFFGDNSCERLIPLEQNPIKHVVLVVKENKTYDEVYGDLKCKGNAYGDGDPNLALFGEKITPNQHALACEFVVFDNFYSDAEASIQGHMWTTQADCNDYVNKTYMDQLPLPGIEPTTKSETGTIFDHLRAHNISYRNYGEVVNFFPEAIGGERDDIDQKYTFFNLNVPDEYKAKEVIREIQNGIFPSFLYVGLPNDHTNGGKAGSPHPECFVADNDYGLALLVDYISHSEYWDSTIIFVVEDDPQSAAGDHIDAHRSGALAISPWVKRGYLSSVHYSYPSVYRTIEMLLGIPSMNRNTATAAPMYDIFTTTPNKTPYSAIKPDVKWRLNPEGTEEAKMSEKYDFSEVDGHPGLGEIIWRIMRPGMERPPYSKRIDD